MEHLSLDPGGGIFIFFFFVLCSLSLLQRSVVGYCGGADLVSFSADSKRTAEGVTGVARCLDSFLQGGEEKEERGALLINSFYYYSCGL